MIMTTNRFFEFGGNCMKTQKKLIQNKVMLLWSLIYLGILIKLIVFKNGNIYYNNINLDLFTFINSYQYQSGITWLINVLGNIILFIPLGIILKYYFSFLRNGHIIFIGIFTSLSFELIQLATNWGIFDVDDLLLNTIGTILGIATYYLFKNIHNSSLATNLFFTSFTTLSFISVCTYYPRLIMI